MRRTTLLLSFSIVAGDLAPEVSAQAPAPSLQDQINAAARIRVVTPLLRAELQRPHLAGDSLSWTNAAAMSRRSGRIVPLASPLPLADVSEIAVSAGNNAGKGALIGGGIGALLGLVVAVGASAEGSTTYSPSGGESAAAVAVTTALGTGIGALLGAASTKWRVVYPVPTEPR